ncbi:hypothetical protein NTCA1_45590 [Novosphingobium sp. TCA1]|nr:hypothetical protein NTCA1_45590 [Novosphingobium sp. TCA1]
MGLAQRDVLHAAHDPVAFDCVADAHLLAHHDENSSKKILKEILESEADRDGANTEARDEARRSKAREDHRGCDHKTYDPDGDGNDRVDQLLEAFADVCVLGKSGGDPPAKSGNQRRDHDQNQSDADIGKESYEAGPH